jgi:ATP-binding cassette, subfamily C, type I secretion system permease/ATPase
MVVRLPSSLEQLVNFPRFAKSGHVPGQARVNAAITRSPGASEKSEIKLALAACRKAFIAFGVFSAFINILALTGSLFMLEVYDRVLPSRSVPTLVGLLSLVIVLYLFQGFVDAVRGRLLSRIAMRLDLMLTERVYRLVVRLPLQAPRGGEGIQPLRDLDTIRGYLSGRGPTALFDLPWLPFYLAICFAFHVWIGVTVLAGAVILFALTLLTEAFSRARVREATQFGTERMRLAELSRRNAEALTAMGMTARLHDRWQHANRKYIVSQLRASDVTDGLGSAGRVFRMMLQSVVLAVGAYLVIDQQATGGIIIASSILSARALAPVDLAISQWKNLVSARQAKDRLEKLLKMMPTAAEPTPLPAPSGAISVENVTVTSPQSPRALIQDVTFALKSGGGLGIIGASASGKSSLARALVGVWATAKGSIRLDSASLDHWSADVLGRHIGFLPQDIELIEGTVSENIARFDPEAAAEGIVEAAKSAGVHELICRLPQGYDTPVGEQGRNLSAGQQQRIALARALYGDPFLVVLDEPNSNLDSEGDEALTQAILGVRARGGIAIVIAHRPSALAGVDHVLALANGRQQAFGPKDEVLAQVLKREPPVQVPAKIVAVTGGQR